MRQGERFVFGDDRAAAPQEPAETERRRDDGENQVGGGSRIRAVERGTAFTRNRAPTTQTSTALSR